MNQQEQTAFLKEIGESAHRGPSATKLRNIIALNCSTSLAWNLARGRDVNPSRITRVLAESTQVELWGPGFGAWIFQMKDGRYCLAEGWFIVGEDNGKEAREVAGLEITYKATPEACLEGPLKFDPRGAVSAELKRCLMRSMLSL